MNGIAASKTFGLVAVWAEDQIKWCTHGPVADSASVVHNGRVDHILPKPTSREWNARMGR